MGVERGGGASRAGAALQNCRIVAEHRSCLALCPIDVLCRHMEEGGGMFNALPADEDPLPLTYWRWGRTAGSGQQTKQRESQHGRLPGGRALVGQWTGQPMARSMICSARACWSCVGER